MEQGKFYEIYTLDGIPFGYFHEDRMYMYGDSPELTTAGSVVLGGDLVHDDKKIGVVGDGWVRRNDGQKFQYKEVSGKILAARLEQRGFPAFYVNMVRSGGQV